MVNISTTCGFADEDEGYEELASQHWTNQIQLRASIMQFLDNMVGKELTTYGLVAKRLGVTALEVGVILKQLEEVLPGRFHTERVLYEGGYCTENYPGGAREQVRRLRLLGVRCYWGGSLPGGRHQVIDFISLRKAA